jgi:hypothetical protein
MIGKHRGFPHCWKWVKHTLDEMGGRCEGLGKEELGHRVG